MPPHHGHDDRPPFWARPEEDEGPLAAQPMNWKRVLGFLKPHAGRLSLATLALLVSSGVGLAFPLVIVRLLDSVTRQGNLAALNTLAALLVGIFLVQAAFSAVQNYLLSAIGEQMVCDLRTSLYDRLHALSFDFYATRRVGDMVSRLSNDVTLMRTLLTTNLTSLLSQSFTLVGAIGIVVAMNARLTLFVVAVVPVIFALAGLFGRLVGNVSTEVQDQVAAATVVAEEGLQGIRVVKSFGREAFETGRYRKANELSLRASLKLSLYQSLYTSGMMFLGFSAIAAIVWMGGREVIAGHLTLAMITGFLMYGMTIAGSLAGLAGVYGQFRAAVGGIKRVFEILDTEPTVQDPPGSVDLPTAQGQITFDRVEFSYDGKVPVLQDVSLDIRAGEILALVGPSGAGKSTIFNLLPRFYDPTSGEIRLDGHPLREATQSSLRAQMAIVPQETMLFGGTIRENILYGRLEASEEEMIAAARSANVHYFVQELPNGYDTVVGERGMNLSGGQRQRIAIARAILKDPAILLLDEATSSLDNESEELVQEAIERLMKGRTTVMIAHRLSTIKVAHRIAVVDKGRIVELGTHEELMTVHGLYARLYSMQFRQPALEVR